MAAYAAIFLYMNSPPHTGASRNVSLLLLSSLMALGWLMPNHYFPWSSAWSDGVTIAGFLCLSLYLTISTQAESRISPVHLVIAALCSITILTQLISGKLLFSGDAVVSALYLALWLTAVATGRQVVSRSGGADMLFGVWLCAALISVAIALTQWTEAPYLAEYSASLPPGMRPFGNLAQSNNFCTLCFLGLCALLWLHQSQRVSGVFFWLGAQLLLLGMIASQSRTGWLQMGLLTLWCVSLREKARLRLSRTQLSVLGLQFVVGVLLWTSVCKALLLTTARTLEDQARAGIRLPYWEAMLDAIVREPLWGYGWQQVGVAQQRVALSHPFIGEYFEHSHNLILDLLLWNGIPTGSLILIALLWWFASRVLRCRDSRTVLLLAALGGVFVHGMLELPLEYAYFLIPVGLLMGATDTLHPSAAKALHVPRWIVICCISLLTTVFAFVAIDYLEAEDNYRMLRLESARIGVGKLVTPASHLRLLTQLEAFLQFARIEAKPGMGPKQVDWMRRVSERFGYPPVMFRYALAAGLNGQPEAANLVLRKICRIHPVARCIEARDGWQVLQSEYPQLTAITAPDPLSGN